MLRRFQLLSFFGILLISCNRDVSLKENFGTKKEFKCVENTKRNVYKNDSISFGLVFKRLIRQKENPFNAPIYNKSTIIYIDTILYSPDNRYAAIIEKCLSEITKKWSYDGGVHFARRTNALTADRAVWGVYESYGARHILAGTLKEMSEIIRF